MVSLIQLTLAWLGRGEVEFGRTVAMAGDVALSGPAFTDVEHGCTRVRLIVCGVLSPCWGHLTEITTSGSSFDVPAPPSPQAEMGEYGVLPNTDPVVSHGLGEL